MQKLTFQIDILWKMEAFNFVNQAKTFYAVGPSFQHDALAAVKEIKRILTASGRLMMRGRKVCQPLLLVALFITSSTHRVRDYRHLPINQQWSARWP